MVLERLLRSAVGVVLFFGVAGMLGSMEQSGKGRVVGEGLARGERWDWSGDVKWPRAEKSDSAGCGA